MNLQDENLQQALKQAPDHDMAPSDAVRQKVFAHAQAASASSNNWLQCFFAKLSRLQLAGMGTIASVVIVVLMVYPQAPDESVWSNAEEADIALTDDVALEKAEPTVRMNKKAPKVKHQLSEQGVVDKVPNKEAAPATSAAPVPAKKVDSMTKKKASLIKRAKQGVTSPVVKQQANDLADSVGQVEAEASTDEAAVIAEADEVMKAEPPTIAATAPKSQTREKGLDAFSNQRPAVASRFLTGATLAKQDISAGHLRILIAANTWPEGQPSVDEGTGLKIELSAMSEKEVAAYNAVVRNWYRENK